MRKSFKIYGQYLFYGTPLCIILFWFTRPTSISQVIIYSKQAEDHDGLNELRSREVISEETPSEKYVCNSLAKLPKNFTICAFEKNDVVSNYIKVGHGWEVPLAKLLYDAFQIEKGAIFFDIGSNIGMHSLSAAVSNSKEVWSLDAVRDTARMLRKSSILSHLQNKMRIINAGISSKRGNFSIWTGSNGNMGGSRLLESGGNGINTIVPTYTLIDYLNYFTRGYTTQQTIIIKMDIESMECKTILASLNAFTSKNYSIPVLILEWVFNQFPKTECPLDMEKKLKEVLRSLDYLPFDVASKKPLNINDNWLTNKLLDVIWFQQSTSKKLRKQLGFV